MDTSYQVLGKAKTNNSKALKAVSRGTGHKFERQNQHSKSVNVEIVK